MSKTITLAPLDRNETGRSGCIGTDTPDGPIAGFAEVDPNGLWSSPYEADEIASEVCRRWNVHADMLEALVHCLHYIEQQHPQGRAEAVKARAAIVKASA